jgi:hypothetical protein
MSAQAARGRAALFSRLALGTSCTCTCACVHLYSTLFL